MRGKQFIFILGTISIGLLCSCQSVESKGDVLMGQVQAKIEEDAELKWMMVTYCFAKEELEGVDLVKFIKEFYLYNSELSSQQVRELLDSLRSEYVDDGSSKLFQIFDAQPGGRLKKRRPN